VIRRQRSFWLAILSSALLLVVAVLQYHWVGQLSRLEAEQLTRSVARQVNLVARNFDRELGRLLGTFSGPADAKLRRDLAGWRSSLGESTDLLQALYRYDLQTGELVEIVAADPADPEAAGALPAREVAWPPELVHLGSQLERIHRAVRNGRVRDPRQVLGFLGGSPLVAEGPALVRPIARPPDRRSDRRRPFARFGNSANLSLLVLQLDSEAVHLVLADLVGRLAEDLDLEVEATLLDRQGNPLGLISRGAWQPAVGDTEFTNRLRTRFHDAMTVPIAPPRAFSGRDFDFFDAGDARPETRPADSPRAGGPGAPWTLAMHLGEGSIRSVVRRQRLGNLLIGGAVWLLMALTAALLYRNAKRAEDFAARQTDFVASISHELHTPLAAISSAGANLADGLVQEPERVREYGLLLQREGDRLGRIVGQALALAGVESSTQRGAAQCALADALAQAADDTQLLAAQGQGEVKFDADALSAAPALAIRQEDLRRVLVNLIENSFKYGARTVSVELSGKARSAARGSQTRARRQGAKQQTFELTLVDDGPGIAADDRERIWQPFRRGRRLHEGALAGSGLGLYLVRRILESAGGSIELEWQRTGEGARFLLELPVAGVAGVAKGREKS
jgi:signal transduction histidine kinase